MPHSRSPGADPAGTGGALLPLRLRGAAVGSVPVPVGSWVRGPKGPMRPILPVRQGEPQWARGTNENPLAALTG